MFKYFSQKESLRLIAFYMAKTFVDHLLSARVILFHLEEVVILEFKKKKKGKPHKMLKLSKLHKI